MACSFNHVLQMAPVLLSVNVAMLPAEIKQTCTLGIICNQVLMLRGEGMNSKRKKKTLKAFSIF